VFCAVLAVIFFSLISLAFQFIFRNRKCVILAAFFIPEKTECPTVGEFSGIHQLFLKKHMITPWLF